MNIVHFGILLSLGPTYASQTPPSSPVEKRLLATSDHEFGHSMVRLELPAALFDYVLSQARVVSQSTDERASYSLPSTVGNQAFLSRCVSKHESNRMLALLY